MERWRGVETIPTKWGRCVVTIGVFDGVHRGHQLIIGRAVEKARELGIPSLVLTFDPHPIEVVRPGSHPPLLTSQRYKADLVEELGVDVFCVLPFTTAFMRLTAEEFVHSVLVEKLHASAVDRGRELPVRPQGRRHGGQPDRRRRAVRVHRRGLPAAGLRADPLVLDLHPLVRGRGRHAGGRRGARARAPDPRRDRARRPARAARSATPRPTSSRCPGAPFRPTGSTPGGWSAASSGCPRRSASGPTRPSPAPIAGSRRSCSTSTGTCTASTWPGVRRQAARHRAVRQRGRAHRPDGDRRRPDALTGSLRQHV